jgi:hypothetical protein
VAALNAAFPNMSVGSLALAPIAATLGAVTEGVYSYTSPGVVLSSANTFIVSFAYPQVTVAKTVLGDELVPGSEYPMEILCTRPDGSAVAPRSVIEPAAFNGTFTLKKGAVKVFGIPEFPSLAVADVCSVREIDSMGATGTYSSTQAAGADGVRPPPLDGVLSDGVYRSAATPATGQIITVTNAFTGELVVSKAVTGDPKSNIGIYELSIACDKNGPTERFLLKDRQTKLFPRIYAGTVCVILETRSDGATATYTDNSGVPNDGSVTIVLTPTSCRDAKLSAAPDCRANVIVTNTYAAAAASTSQPAAPTTAAAAPAPAPTSVPEAVAAPAIPVVEEPTFAG